MLRIAPALALSLLVPACLDESADQVTSTDEASTVLDVCATDGNANAYSSITYGTDSYTRHASRINPGGSGNCDCQLHQWYAYNYDDATANALVPTCRAWTDVDFSVGGQQLGYLLGAYVGTWDASVGQTMCGNSELEVELQQYDYATAKYVTIWEPSTTQRPSWINGACRGPTVLTPQGWVLSGNYRIRARARRGLFKNNNGYETVTVEGIPAT